MLNTANELYLSEPDGTELTRIHDHTGLAGGFAGWSGDGRNVLFQNNPPTQTALFQQGMAAWRLRMTPKGEVTGEQEQVLPAFPIIYNPVYSRDARAIVGSHLAGYKLIVIPIGADGLPSGPTHVTGDDPPMEGWAAINGATFNPDRTRIVFTGCRPGYSACGIYVVPVDAIGAATGPPVLFALDDNGPVMFPSWSPDGRFIAFQDSRGAGTRLVLRRVDPTGQPIGPEKTVSTDYYFNGFPAAAWSPDSRAIAFTIPYDPDLALGGGTATFVVELDAEGNPVGQARHLGLVGWGASQPQWGTLPPEPAPVENPSPTPDTTPVPAVEKTPEPVTTVPPPPAPQPAGLPVAPAALPSNRKCVSRRKFTIRLKESKADPLERAEVYLGKNRVKVVTGARLKAAIDLRGLPKGKVIVKVIGTTASGRRVTSTRTYRTCTSRKKR